MPRKRRQKDEDESKSNAWLATFNDLMTLLLTFFVLLLSMGSLEGGKVKSMASSLDSALGVLGSGFYKEYPVFTPIMQVLVYGKKYKQVQNLPHVGEDEQGADQITRHITREEGEGSPDNYGGGMETGSDYKTGKVSGEARGSIDMKELPAAEVRKPAHPLEKQAAGIKADLDGMRYRVDDQNNLIIELPSTVLFDVGKADLRPEAAPVLKKISELIARNPDYEILVQGHTDDRPISTEQFPSNWELSAARASTVLRRIIKPGEVQPSRFMASGYADSRPAAPNDTEDHRALNRRVEIKLIKKESRKGNG
jgi:chemotaxis protein MotB